MTTPVVIGRPQLWRWHGEPPEPGDLFIQASGSVRMVTAYKGEMAGRFQNDVHGRRKHRIEVVRVDPGTVDLDECIWASPCKSDGTRP